MIIIIIMILFLILFMYLEPLFSKYKIKKTNEYGSARFSSKNEIKSYFKNIK